MPPALVGRRDEQRALDALVAGARLGSSGVLVSPASPGSARPRCSSDAAEARPRLALLRATGTEAERDLPFAGLAQLLRPLADAPRAPAAPQAQALAWRWRSARAPARPVRRVRGRPRPGHAGGEDRPVGIVVDDAHLLDRPSAEALAFLARRLLADAVFVLVAQRPGDAPNGCVTNDIRSALSAWEDVCQARDQAHQVITHEVRVPTCSSTASPARPTAPATASDSAIPPSSVSGTTPTSTTSRGAVPAKSRTMRASLMEGSCGLTRMPVGRRDLVAREHADGAGGSVDGDGVDEDDGVEADEVGGEVERGRAEVFERRRRAGGGEWRDSG